MGTQYRDLGGIITESVLQGADWGTKVAERRINDVETIKRYAVRIPWRNGVDALQRQAWGNPRAGVHAFWSAEGKDWAGGKWYFWEEH